MKGSIPEKHVCGVALFRKPINSLLLWKDRKPYLNLTNYFTNERTLNQAGCPVYLHVYDDHLDHKVIQKIEGRLI